MCPLNHYPLGLNRHLSDMLTSEDALIESPGEGTLTVAFCPRYPFNTIYRPYCNIFLRFYPILIIGQQLKKSR